MLSLTAGETIREKVLETSDKKTSISWINQSDIENDQWDNDQVFSVDHDLIVDHADLETVRVDGLLDHV